MKANSALCPREIATALNSGHFDSTYAGELLRFRRVGPEDAELISQSIETASSETLMHRFFAPIRTVPVSRLRELLKFDEQSDFCFIGELHTPSGPRAIFGARYVRIDDPITAEIAMTVHDQVQGQGWGTLLMKILANLARPVGIERFEAFVLPSNLAMLSLLRKVAPGHQRYSLGDTLRIVLSVEEILALSKQQDPAVDDGQGLAF